MKRFTQSQSDSDLCRAVTDRIRSMKIYCPECERKCDESDPICPNCGHRLQSSESFVWALSDTPPGSPKVQCPVCDGTCFADANVCPTCSHPLKWHGPPGEVAWLHCIGGLMMIGAVIWFIVAIALSDSYSYAGDTDIYLAGAASTMFLGLLTYAAGTALSLLAIIASKR